jgi:hypothetical protein
VELNIFNINLSMDNKNREKISEFAKELSEFLKKDEKTETSILEQVQNEQRVTVEYRDKMHVERNNILNNYAKENSIGSLVYSFRLRDIDISYSRHDYFRRIICNIIGKWVENGEYTNDEKTLKKLIEDILYYNIKKAIE